VAAGGLAALAVPWATRGRGVSPFAPGELDLVLGARLIATGSRPWPWEAAVHPDALGTALEAAALVPLLGLGDVGALRTLGALHLGLFVGAVVWLAARLDGTRAGVVAGLLALCPATLAAHTRTMGTTAEAAGLQLLTLGAAIAATRRGTVGAAAAVGLLAGLGIAFSLHGVVLAGLLAVVIARAGGRLAGAFGAATAAAAALRGVRDPDGPGGSWWRVLSREPGEVASLLDPGDVAGWLARLPQSAWPDAGPWGLPWVLAVLAGLALAAVAVRRGGERRVVGAYALLAAASLLPAADLMGYPAAWRYHLVLLGPLAVLGGARVPLPLAAVGAAVALALAPGGAAPELDRPAAAFYAGQHRLLVRPQRPPHEHVRRLWPVVAAPEQEGFAQGYGLHLGREFARIPDADAARWWAFAAELPSRRRAGFARGFGLGLAEDGALSAPDLQALGACPPGLVEEVWVGVGAALGERAHFGVGGPLQVRWAELRAVSLPGLRRGIAETVDGTPPADLLPLDAPPAARDAVASEPKPPQRLFGLRHPLTYARLEAARSP